jgi:hypothetical protein
MEVIERTINDSLRFRVNHINEMLGKNLIEVFHVIEKWDIGAPAYYKVKQLDTGNFTGILDFNETIKYLDGLIQGIEIAHELIKNFAKER